MSNTISFVQGVESLVFTHLDGIAWRKGFNVYMLEINAINRNRN